MAPRLDPPLTTQLLRNESVRAETKLWENLAGSWLSSSQSTAIFRFATTRRKEIFFRGKLGNCSISHRSGSFRDKDHHAGQGRSVHHAVAVRHTTAPSLLLTHGSVEVDATIQVGIRPHHSRASVEAGKAARAAISIAHLHQESMDIILRQLSIPGHPERPLTVAEQTEYRGLVGRLLWLQSQTRPDLSARGKKVVMVFFVQEQNSNARRFEENVCLLTECWRVGS